MMNAKLAKVYYSSQGYWKRIAAIKKLANAAKVSEDAAKKWQALWQIYLPAPKRIRRPKFDVSAPNAVHQGDLFFCHTTPSVVVEGEKLANTLCQLSMLPAGSKKPRRVCRGCEGL